MMTNPTVYRLLNQEAKGWWAHKDLRKAGKHQEARARERENIRMKVRHLRDCYLFSVGRGGFTLHGRYIESPDGNGGSQGKLQGYGNGEYYAKCLLIARPEVPHFNSTTASSEKIMRTLRFPLASDRVKDWDEPKDGAYNSMQYCPVGILLACHESIGSTVYWGDLDAEMWRAMAAPTITKVNGKA